MKNPRQIATGKTIRISPWTMGMLHQLMPLLQEYWSALDAQAGREPSPISYNDAIRTLVGWFDDEQRAALQNRVEKLKGAQITCLQPQPAPPAQTE